MKEEILSIINDNLIIKEEPINEKTSFKSISLDSLAFINVLVYIEERYNISFMDSELNINNYKCINDLLILIKNKINNEKNNK